MPIHGDPRDDAYDVIVVGSGLGGVSAAAFLAKAGKKVLVVERQDGPGGYAHAFRRGPYLFDPAVHVIPQGRDGQILDVLLRLLGVRDRCTLIPIEDLYGAVLPDFQLRAPIGKEGFIAAHARHFPHDAEGLQRFIQVCTRIAREAQQVMPQLSLRELDQAVEQYPTLFRYRTTTLSEALEEFLTDPRLQALLTAQWPYLGLPPSRLSFFLWANLLYAFLEDGALYCQGSFQQLVDAFVAALELNGGELVLCRHVTRIRIQDGRVVGVRLEDGREIRAPIVVSNADARQTFEDLVGMEHLPESFMRRYRRLRLCLSGFVVFAATDLDLGQLDVAHETFLYRHWNHEETYQDILAGRPGGMWMNVPSLADPSLAPEREHILILSSLVPYEIGAPWEQEKERYTEELLGAFETVVPGLRNHLTFVEGATPLTLERYSLNSRGALYGWENTPVQAGSQRLSHQTPIDGLYLSGHWSQPGSGSLRVIYSGVQTAQILLGYATADQFIKAMTPWTIGWLVG